MNESNNCAFSVMKCYFSVDSCFLESLLNCFADMSLEIDYVNSMLI